MKFISTKKLIFIAVVFLLTLTVVSAADNETADSNVNQTATDDVNESVKIPSTIKGSDYTAYVGVKNTYKVVLKSNNTPLSNKVVKFTVNGKTVEKKTNKKGEASININLAKGKYTIRYTYDGDNNTQKTAGQSKITVIQTSKTTLKKANSIIYRNLKSDYFKVKLLDIRGDPIKNAKIIFKIKGKKYTKKTNEKGVAGVKIKLKTGTYKVKVSFKKTSKFKKSSKTYTIKVKPKYTRNNGFWLLARDMDSVNFNKLEKYGTKHIFLNAKAIETHGRKGVEKFIKDAKKHKIKVHLWVQIFYSKKTGWQNPLKNGKFNYNLMNSKLKTLKSYAKLKGIGGIHLDYIRYPGNAHKYANSVKVINYFTKKASKTIHGVSKKLIVSAAVMPEPSSMKKYYAQDISTMSKYLDVIVPMVYKGNYNAGHSWIKYVTNTFKKQSKHAKIWTGLQTYKGDKNLKKLSASELMGDADSASLAGAYGVMLFRYALVNYINFNEV